MGDPRYGGDEFRVALRGVVIRCGVTLDVIVDEVLPSIHHLRNAVVSPSLPGLVFGV